MKQVIAAVAMALVFSAVAGAEEIRVEGGGTAIATVFKPIKSRFEKLYGHSLDIVQSTAVKGLIAVSEGRVDIAAGAHPLEDLVAGAAKEGKVIDKGALVATPIEENELVVVTNRQNIVTKLSKQQLKGIFSGKISNWRDVGGDDLPVKVVWGKETGGQNIQFTRVALDGEPVSSKPEEATNYRDIYDRVAVTPGAVGVLPAQMVSSRTKTIETLTIKSPIYVITKGTPSPKVQQVLDFYKKEYAAFTQ